MSSTSALIVALVGGLVSFVSPCVIPLVPAYLSFLTGLTPEELTEEGSRNKTLIPALLFVLGFSIIFVAMGASVSLLGAFLRSYQQVLRIAGGLLIALFGLFMTGLVKAPWLYGEYRLDLSKAQMFGRFSGLFMGMAFAAGWTPCIGPVLGTILTLASRASSASWGIVLLLAYSAGLALPFLCVALLFGKVAPHLRALTRYSVVINRIAGVILIMVGLLVATNLFGRLSLVLAGTLPAFDVSLPSLE